MAAVGAWLAPGPRVAPAGAWPVPWAQCDCRGGEAGPLVPVWPPWRRGRSPALRSPLWGRGRSP